MSYERDVSVRALRSTAGTYHLELPGLAGEVRVPRLLDPMLGAALQTPLVAAAKIPTPLVAAAKIPTPLVAAAKIPTPAFNTQLLSIRPGVKLSFPVIAQGRVQSSIPAKASSTDSHGYGVPLQVWNKWNSDWAKVIAPAAPVVRASHILSASQQDLLLTRPLDFLMQVFDPIENIVAQAVKDYSSRFRVTSARMPFTNRLVDLRRELPGDEKYDAATLRFVKRLRTIAACMVLLFDPRFGVILLVDVEQPVVDAVREFFGYSLDTPLHSTTPNVPAGETVRAHANASPDFLRSCGWGLQNYTDDGVEVWTLLPPLHTGGNGTSSDPIGGVGGGGNSATSFLRFFTRAGVTMSVVRVETGLVNRERYIFARGSDGYYYKFKMPGTGIGNEPSDSSVRTWFSHTIAGVPSSQRLKPAVTNWTRYYYPIGDSRSQGIGRVDRRLGLGHYYSVGLGAAQAAVPAAEGTAVGTDAAAGNGVVVGIQAIIDQITGYIGAAWAAIGDVPIVGGLLQSAIVAIPTEAGNEMLRGAGVNTGIGFTQVDGQVVAVAQTPDGGSVAAVQPTLSNAPPDVIGGAFHDVPPQPSGPAGGASGSAGSPSWSSGGSSSGLLLAGAAALVGAFVIFGGKR